MTQKQKRMLLRILISALLLVGAILIPFSGIYRFLLFLIPYGVIGWDVLRKALLHILNGQMFDENFLMTVATVGAFCIGEYPEAAAVMLLYQVGELFQSFAVGKSRSSIASLMNIRPDSANRDREGCLEEISPDEAAIGDIIVIKPGEKVPLDGVVLEGKSALDTAALTGESLPREVGPGDNVISGCINQIGLLRVRVTKAFGDSTVVKILDLVENSAAKKAQSENFITRFAKYYTPCVVFGALLLALLPPLFSGGFWREWIHRALIFLVISCPCALVISVPLSFFGGIGGASGLGILVKGGNYLEALSRAETIVFDKTGTLTEGVFKVTAVHPDSVPENRLLEFAALAESYSDHPISLSLKKACQKKLDPRRVGEVKELSGRGVCAVVDGKKICAGNEKFMEELGISWNPCHLVGTTVHVALDGVYAGHIIISDEIKPEASDAFAALKKQGIKKTVMLTGDSAPVGKEVARKLGIDEVYTGLLPGDKVERVESLLVQKSEKGKLVFVGDGINDAPVLSRADIGIAMGAMGADAAIEAADIVLMDDKLSKIAQAIKISKKTLRIARQNIVFALAVKVLILVLGALGLAGMWEAVFADVGVSVLAVLNAARTLRG